MVLATIWALGIEALKPLAKVSESLTCGLKVKFLGCERLVLSLLVVWGFVDLWKHLTLVIKREFLIENSLMILLWCRIIPLKRWTSI